MRAHSIRLIIEIVGAVAFLLLPLIIVPVLAPIAAAPPLRPVLWGTLIVHSVIIAYYFLISYYGLPALYFRGERGRYALLTLVSLSVVLFVALSDRAFNPFAYGPLPNALLLFVLSVVARFLMITFIAVAVAGYVRLKKAEEEQLRAELSLLKAQVNPHFLFNTLNSIYALAVTRSDRAPQAITQLAGMMRYMLDESQSDEVDLAGEISSISSYVALEKLRVSDNVQVDFHVEGDVTGRKIAPLLLLPLVENAFKHGVSTEKPCRIEIRGHTTANGFVLEVTNTRCKNSGAQGGMGLANLRRRLALLPGTNTLRITGNDATFIARLELSPV